MTEIYSDQKVTPTIPCTSNLHGEMHQDHLKWLGEIANWQDDITEWQGEIRQVLKGLSELQKTLEEQSISLVTQSEALFSHRQGTASHEHEIAQFEQGGTGGDLVAAAGAHRRQSENHEQLKLTHEATKQWQHSLVSQWEHLHKAVFGMKAF